MKKRFLAVLLTLVMVLAIVPQAAFAANGSEASTQKAEPTAEIKADSTKAVAEGTTVLAFTSDIHNGTASGAETNVGNNRLSTWLSNVQQKYDNKVQVMGFCGDMATAQRYDADYWGFAQTVMNNISSKSITGVYAVGNHEYANGHMGDSGSGGADTQASFILNNEGRSVNSENYRIYCLGTNYGHGSSWAYEDSQITSLTNYLNSVGNDKVIIILTHFPLHNYGMHRTSNTLPVLNAINTAAKGADGTYGTSDDKKIVFLWGHNHSEGDTNYDQVWLPGDSINDDNKSTVYFFYAAAGSMADSEYGSSGRVKGKGLVLTIDDQKLLSFSYFDASGNNVTEPSGETISEQPKEPVAIEDVSITNSNPTVKIGRTLQLKYSTAPQNATVASVSWDSNNKSVATVDKSGKVTGVSLGSATITLTISDGLTRATVSTSTVVEVTEAGGSEEYTVNITPTTDNPEQSIRIDVGDTLTINVTNGSSSSAYGFTATLGNSGIAQIQGSSTLSIAAGATGQFTFEGVADGTVDITIQNNNTYGSQYARKGVIHLTVGEGGTTPVDPPTGDTVNITPSTDNPEQSIKINVGDTLTINVTNGSSSSAYDFTATLSNSGIAQIQGNTTVNIAAGGTGTFTVKGLSNGTVDITIQNNNTYGSQYARKGVIHLTVGEGGTTPVDPPTGDTVNITPSTDNPEQSIKISVGDTLTINVTNGSSNSGYDFTATLSNSGIAQIQGNSTINIAQGGTGTFTVKGLAEGTVDITIQNNQSSSSYVRKGVIHLTVGDGGTTPVDPPVGETVTYQLATALEAGKEYIIANGNSGSVYVVSNEANGSKTLKGIAATVSDDKITLSSTDAAKAVFAVEANSNSAQNGLWLKNGSQYLYADSTDGLRLVASSTQTSSSNNAKSWHYRGDSKNLLWFFKDTSSSDGYTDTSTTYKYYLNPSNGNFTDGHVDTTSLANTNTPAIYLYEKVTEQVDVESITLSPASLSMTVGDSENLTVTVTPSNATNKAVTWSSSNNNVATVANGVVTAVAAGTATITVTSVADGSIKATCAVTVKNPDPGAQVTYVLTDVLEDGKEYIIANGNSGSVYLVSTEAGSSRQLKGVSATVSDSRISITEEVAAKTAFTAEKKTSPNGALSVWLKNDGKYLYTNNSDGLRMVEASEQGSSDNSGKFWHYKGDSKNLLWYFKDTNSSDGYTDTSGTYKYYLECNNGIFTDNHATSTSLANTNTPAIYLYVKDDSQVIPTGNYTLTVTANKTEVLPGDTVDFTVTLLGPVANLGSMQMTLDIPEGITYKANSGKLTANLAQTLGFAESGEAHFTESTRIINAYGDHDYASANDTVLATFSCTIDEDFSGSATVSLKNMEFYSADLDETIWVNISSQFTATGAEIRLHEHTYGAPTWTWTGNNAATATFTCSDCAAETPVSQTVTATVTSAEGTGSNIGYTVYTASAVFNGQTYTDTRKEVIEYTITLNGLDGAEYTGTNQIKYTVESDTFSLPTPSKAGYDFLGWTGEGLTNAQTVTITKGSTGNRTYTANWEVSGYAVTGNITSFVGTREGYDSYVYEEGPVSVKLYDAESGELAYTATVSSNNKTYAFDAVANGNYRMEVSKKDHVTRNYGITVNNAAVTMAVTIHLIGDVNGDGIISTVDAALANAHAREAENGELTGYEFDCADVNNDREITTVDAAIINMHAREYEFLW